LLHFLNRFLLHTGIFISNILDIKDGIYGVLDGLLVFLETGAIEGEEVGV